ncbi:MAG: SDR family oxidoreductase [Saprospiraceae bacterium]
MLIVITGGTKGIGRAIAEKFAKEDFDIAICARTTADLKAAKKELLKLNPLNEILAEKVDMQSKKQVEKFAKKILDKWGGVDVLVNNAAAFIQGSFLEEPDGLLENMMATNVYGSYYLTRKLLPALINQKKGHIFNICSVASQKVYPDCSSYVISKFALLGFSKVLRHELMDKNIKVTSVIPGATLTNSWAGVELPEGRIMPSEDVANTIWSAYNLGPSSTIEEIVMRPQLGDL